MSSFPVIVPGGNVSQSTALSTPSVSPDASGGLNQPYQLGLSSEPSFSLPQPVSTGTFFNPDSDGTPTFSTTVYGSSPDDSESSLISSLPDPLLSLASQSSLPSAQSLQEGIAGGNAVTDWLNGFLGAGSSQQPPSLLGSALGNTGPVPSIGSSISSGLSSFAGSTFAGFSWGRIGSFLLALILIAAGLYLFGSQSAQGVITRTVRRGLEI